MSVVKNVNQNPEQFKKSPAILDLSLANTLAKAII